MERLESTRADSGWVTFRGPATRALQYVVDAFTVGVTCVAITFWLHRAGRPRRRG
jgi:hypothetical protein